VKPVGANNLTGTNRVQTNKKVFAEKCDAGYSGLPQCQHAELPSPAPRIVVPKNIDNGMVYSVCVGLCLALGTDLTGRPVSLGFGGGFAAGLQADLGEEHDSGRPGIAVNDESSFAAAMGGYASGGYQWNFDGTEGNQYGSGTTFGLGVAVVGMVTWTWG
jgi:hypothetical protein